MYETIALKSLTSFRIGGKASVLFVKEEKDVILSCENAFILGRGTNILAGEKISCPIVAVRLDGIEFDGESVVVKGGTP